MHVKWILAGPYIGKLFGRDVDLEPYDLTKIMKTNSIEFSTERQITVIHGANDGNSATTHHWSVVDIWLEIQISTFYDHQQFWQMNFKTSCRFNGNYFQKRELIFTMKSI